MERCAVASQAHNDGGLLTNFLYLGTRQTFGFQIPEQQMVVCASCHELGAMLWQVGAQSLAVCHHPFTILTELGASNLAVNSHSYRVASCPSRGKTTKVKGDHHKTIQNDDKWCLSCSSHRISEALPRTSRSWKANAPIVALWGPPWSAGNTALQHPTPTSPPWWLGDTLTLFIYPQYFAGWLICSAALVVTSKLTPTGWGKLNYRTMPEQKAYSIHTAHT